MDAHQQIQCASIPQLRVLVVESDISSHCSLSNLINSCGYTCGVCLCGTDALHILREKDRKKPDIVLIAFDLSHDMSGLELLEIVKKNMVDLPVIMMAASDGNPTHLHEATRLGCQGYILKPVNEEPLREMLRRVDVCMKFPPSNVGSTNGSGDSENMSKKRVLEEGSKSFTGYQKQVVFSSSCMRNPKKKNRLVWTEDLNKVFVAVLNDIGLRNATPNKILAAMHDLKYEDLTREHIASRLQKYKISLERASDKGKKRALEDHVGDMSTDSHHENSFASVRDAGNPMKKARLVWTDDLKKSFDDYVNNIGLENATPNKILKAMEALKYEGLTRDQIASHLQKYRKYVKGASKSTESVPCEEETRALEYVNNISANPHHENIVFSDGDEGSTREHIMINFKDVSTLQDKVIAISLKLDDLDLETVLNKDHQDSSSAFDAIDIEELCSSTITEEQARRNFLDNDQPCYAYTKKAQVSEATPVNYLQMAASSTTSQATVPDTVNNSEVDDNICSETVDEAHDSRLLGNEDVASSDIDISFEREGSGFSILKEAQGSQPVRNEDDDNDCSGIAGSIDGSEASCLSRDYL